MKKYILIILTAFIIYIATTVIYAFSFPLASEWAARFLMLGNVATVTLLTYLIFQKAYKLKLFGAFTVVVLISAILKYIANAMDGDLSFGYLLLIGVLIVYVIDGENENE